LERSVGTLGYRAGSRPALDHFTAIVT
jgi:hypothetical protein